MDNAPGEVDTPPGGTDGRLTADCRGGLKAAPTLIASGEALTPPAPGEEPAPLSSGGVPAPLRSRRARWIVGGGAAAVLLAGGGAIAYGQLAKDPGVAACEAIRDSRVSVPGRSTDLTQPQYQEIRKLFDDSHKKAIREHGTKLVDLTWQVKQMGADAGFGALALFGPLMEHLAGLQSACADEGVVFALPEFGADGQPASADPFGEDTTAAPAPTEGSAATAAWFSWPDGVTVDLDRAEVVDRSLGYEIPMTKSLVKVTATFRNTTSEPIPIEAMSSWLTVLYGPNRTQAEPEPGYSTDDKSKQLSNPDEPTRIAAAGSVQMWRTYEVPNEQLSELAIQVQEPQLPGTIGAPATFMFTEVEKLLKR